MKTSENGTDNFWTILCPCLRTNIARTQTANSQAYWSLQNCTGKKRCDHSVSISNKQLLDLINFQNRQAECLAENSVDIEMKYKNNSNVKTVDKGTELEDRIYRGRFEAGYKTRNLDVDVMLASLNNLLELQITNQHYVQRIFTIMLPGK